MKRAKNKDASVIRWRKRRKEFKELTDYLKSEECLIDIISGWDSKARENHSIKLLARYIQAGLEEMTQNGKLSKPPDSPMFRTVEYRNDEEKCLYCKSLPDWVFELSDTKGDYCRTHKCKECLQNRTVKGNENENENEGLA